MKYLLLVLLCFQTINASSQDEGNEYNIRERDKNIRNSKPFKDRKVKSCSVKGFTCDGSPENKIKDSFQELFYDSGGYLFYWHTCIDSSDSDVSFKYDQWKNKIEILIYDHRIGRYSKTCSAYDSLGFEKWHCLVYENDSSISINVNKNKLGETYKNSKYSGEFSHKYYYNDKYLITSEYSCWQQVTPTNRVYASSNHGFKDLVGKEKRIRIDSTYEYWDGIMEETVEYYYDQRDNVLKIVTNHNYNKYYVTIAFDFNQETKINYHSDTINTRMDSGKVIKIVSRKFDSFNNLIAEVDSAPSSTGWDIGLDEYIYCDNKIISHKIYRLWQGEKLLEFNDSIIYNRNGLKAKVISNVTSEEYVREEAYKYDQNGRIVRKLFKHIPKALENKCTIIQTKEEWFYDSHGKLKRKIKYCYTLSSYPMSCNIWKEDTKYNVDGRHILTKQYDSGNNLFRKIIYEFDEMGHETKILFQDANGIDSWKIERTYDKDFLLLSEKEYDNNGDLFLFNSYSYYYY